MRAFSALGIYEQGIYLQIHFIIVVFACYHAAVMIYEKRWRSCLRIICIPLLGVLDTVLLFGIYHTFKQQWIGEGLQGFCASLAQLPSVLPVLCSALSFGYLLFLSADDRLYRARRISRSSVKEAVDNLPSGLCLAAENGRLMLANHRMHALCRQITEDSLQDANLFWAAVRAESVNHEPDYAEVQLADGSWWSFRRSFYQDGAVTLQEIAAADISEQKAVYLELMEKNGQLQERNERMKQYSRDTARVTRERERLSFKTRIHRQMGELLLSTWHMLSQNPAAEDCVRFSDRWQQQIHALRNAEMPEENTGSWEMLRQTASMVGLSLHLQGSLPASSRMQEMFAAAAAEAVTNAVKHAQAQVIDITVEHTADTVRMHFTNDGAAPQQEGTLGGGLGSLREKFERSGGALSVEWTPRFVLTVMLPEQREEL